MEFQTAVQAVASEPSALAPDKFAEIVEPEADGGAVAAQIGEDYGFRPMVANLFDTKALFLPHSASCRHRGAVAAAEVFDADSLRRSIDEGLNWVATGY